MKIGLVWFFFSQLSSSQSLLLFSSTSCLPASAALATDSAEGTLHGAAGWDPSLFQGDIQIFRISSKGLPCVIPITAPFPSVIRFYSSGAPSKKSNLLIRTGRQVREALLFVAALPEAPAVRTLRRSLSAGAVRAAEIPLGIPLIWSRGILSSL